MTGAAVVGVGFALLAMPPCREDFNQRITQATQVDDAPTPHKSPRVVTRLHVDPTAEETSTPEPRPEDSSTRTQSYADPRWETLARLQECAPDEGWDCGLQFSGPLYPFYLYPNYTHYNAGQERSIVCSFHDFEDFRAYIAVNPWTSQIQVADDPKDPTFYSELPYFLQSQDPCDALNEHRDGLFEAADTQLEIVEEWLEDADFEYEESDAGPYCFRRAEWVADLDTATPDTGSDEVGSEALVICLSENALWCTSGWSVDGGPLEEALTRAVNHPDQLSELVDEELEDLLP